MRMREGVCSHVCTWTLLDGYWLVSCVCLMKRLCAVYFSSWVMLMHPAEFPVMLDYKTLAYSTPQTSCIYRWCISVDVWANIHIMRQLASPENICSRLQRREGDGLDRLWGTFQLKTSIILWHLESTVLFLIGVSIWNACKDFIFYVGSLFTWSLLWAGASIPRAVVRYIVMLMGFCAI